MSRIGKQPIKVPSGVTVAAQQGEIVVRGSKGELKQKLLPGLDLQLSDGLAVISRKHEDAAHKARHGLLRSLVQNMVTGVNEGFSKQLELTGVGYRVATVGTDLKLNIGFSHDVIYKLPAGVNASVEQNIITISGIDKQQVGQVAAEIRALKKPEPYKGKGIKYVGERIIRKSGKSGKEK